MADAIVAGHLLALEVKVEDGGLVGAFGGEGEGGLVCPQARDDDDPRLELGMELAWCVHGLSPLARKAIECRSEMWYYRFKGKCRFCADFGRHKNDEGPSAVVRDPGPA